MLASNTLMARDGAALYNGTRFSAFCAWIVQLIELGTTSIAELSHLVEILLCLVCQA